MAVSRLLQTCVGNTTVPLDRSSYVRSIAFSDIVSPRHHDAYAACLLSFGHADDYDDDPGCDDDHLPRDCLRACRFVIQGLLAWTLRYERVVSIDDRKKLNVILTRDR